MIEIGERLLLVGKDREYFMTAGEGQFSTDRGMIDLLALVGMNPGDEIRTHLDVPFTVLRPRPTDFFVHARRSGAPMLPKDIGMVIAYTGMNRDDRVLDAGTGSGVAAIYFGKIAREVKTYEVRPEFARLAERNIREARLDNVEVIAADMLDATGEFDVVHLDLGLSREHVEHAYSILSPGGYLACYTPFLEHTFTALDAATPLFRDVHCYECMERELMRSARGTRPSTRVAHSGYITIARK
ncbi:tRNA (adenine-N1)-methyltransferase [Methanoculleus thermophilus]|jgi:tRNA (adenine57-N1/adenine58-N1)-methyltransferase|uniref:tRNA (Adenine57-N1/adenine58-N1)-methyltransferase n=1 Tax=Methanoculleus thermophilus TaxID=2200 RepID=A0A1G9AMQ5_9EURY|nr:methyltransferase domain-containing protein [Methanoculleus thermophilus]NLN09050.1 methyltransferase domain-containing protein [Methanoculleus thermophilus]SDK28094.1 tRNA (adenine57-N1/adenine58-N1)-methyltransferase [Methanoculleus thermophilus]